MSWYELWGKSHLVLLILEVFIAILPAPKPHSLVDLSKLMSYQRHSQLYGPFVRDMASAGSILVLVSRRFIIHHFTGILMLRLGNEGRILVSMTSQFTPSVVAGDANLKYTSDNASLVAIE